MSSFRLPLLEQRREALETCVYCPKLCRAACPVSNAEPSETLIPWGKMSMAYFAARGDARLDEDLAAPAWACTGCHACRELCDHKNDVATTLLDARAAFFARGVAPSGVGLAADRFERHAENAAEVARGLSKGAVSTSTARVLVGCSYLRNSPDVASQALAVTESLLGVPARPVEACCGLPLLLAGDRTRFVRAADRLAAEVAGASPLVVVDPGCARTLLFEYPRLGIDVAPAIPLVDLATQHAHRFARIEGATPPRYHDPCQLGRGLGRYDEPRALLTKLAGAPPREFDRAREHGECSGAGGLLPESRPETSAAIADARIAAHRDAGGGELVTACGASLRRFRASGEPAQDLVTWLARGLGIATSPDRGA